MLAAVLEIIIPHEGRINGKIKSSLNWWLRLHWPYRDSHDSLLMGREESIPVGVAYSDSLEEYVFVVEKA